MAHNNVLYINSTLNDYLIPRQDNLKTLVSLHCRREYKTRTYTLTQARIFPMEFFQVQNDLIRNILLDIFLKLDSHKFLMFIKSSLWLIVLNEKFL